MLEIFPTYKGFQIYSLKSSCLIHIFIHSPEVEQQLPVLCLLEDRAHSLSTNLHPERIKFPTPLSREKQFPTPLTIPV